MILVRNPVHAALFLVLSFVTAAGLWLLLYAEFLAITLVLVYVGAVMVLFLFVVMMLDINIDKLREGFWGNLPLAAVVGILMAGEMVLLLMRGFDAPVMLAGRPHAGLLQHQGAGPGALHRLRVRLRAGRRHPAGGHRGGDRAHAAPSQGNQVPGSRRAGHRARFAERLEDRSRGCK